jgi:hypothetical protein
MWYIHQVFSGTFAIGVIGNITAAVIGFIIGLITAHKVYDLRAVHKAIKEHTTKHKR